MCAASAWQVPGCDAPKEITEIEKDERKIQVMKSRVLIFTAILSAVACFDFLPQAEAVTPPPDGCYPNFTTAEGSNALQSLSNGVGNTATGWHSLFANTAGSLNTGVGAGALLLTTETTIRPPAHWRF